jgi:integrase
MVTSTLQRVKHSDGRSTLERAQPKTKTSMRRIPLTAAAVDALKRHAQRQAQQRAMTGSEWTDTGLVYTNDRGGAEEPRHLLSRSFAPLLSEAGIPHVRFHDPRHTAATLMAAQGVHTQVVSEMLGDASVGITIDLYSHVTSSMAQQASQRWKTCLPEAPSEAHRCGGGDCAHHRTSPKCHVELVAAVPV